MNDRDLEHLSRAVDLAEQALVAGEEPYGSVLAAADGTVLFEDHNRTSGGDQTRHPEFEIARWAANRIPPSERAGATVYTSGEHCAMCSAAHGWVGLGPIVYAVSSRRLDPWRREGGAGGSPMVTLSVNEVRPDLPVLGPDPELEGEMRELHERAFRRS